MVHSRRVTVARARPRASRSRAKDSMWARRTANRARERARHQVVNWRRSSVYASLVGPRYPARYPASASRSASVKAGLIVASAVDGAAVVIGHLPAGLRPERLGQLRVPAIERNPTVGRIRRSRHVIASGTRSDDLPLEKCSDYALGGYDQGRILGRRRSPGYGLPTVAAGGWPLPGRLGIDEPAAGVAVPAEGAGLRPGPRGSPCVLPGLGGTRWLSWPSQVRPANGSLRPR